MIFDSPNVNRHIERYKSNCPTNSRWNRVGIRSKRERISKQLLNESIGRSDIGADDKWSYHNCMCDWVNTFITAFLFNSSFYSITHAIVIIHLSSAPIFDLPMDSLSNCFEMRSLLLLIPTLFHLEFVGQLLL